MMLHFHSISQCRISVYSERALKKALKVDDFPENPSRESYFFEIIDSVQSCNGIDE